MWQGPEGPFRQGVKFVEQWCDDLRIEGHEHHGNHKDERPQVQGHPGPTVQQDVDKSGQEGRRNQQRQQLTLDQVRKVQAQRLLVEAVPAVICKLCFSKQHLSLMYQMWLSY